MLWAAARDAAVIPRPLHKAPDWRWIDYLCPLVRDQRGTRDWNRSSREDSGSVHERTKVSFNVSAKIRPSSRPIFQPDAISLAAEGAEMTTLLSHFLPLLLIGLVTLSGAAWLFRRRLT